MDCSNSQFSIFNSQLSIGMMHLIPFHINRAKRSGRAEVLAGTAADAFGRLDGGDHYGLTVMLVFHHLDSTGGAVAFAVAAADAVGEYHTVILDPNGMSDMDVGLFLACDGLDGTSRADLAATRAFGTAVAALKRHYRLHEMLEFS